ncbi:MAG: hypothetical protein IPK19_41470 [Chloroflexi bacterium]|nr:hypothetical protein [Chloroflexota bacterium]
MVKYLKDETGRSTTTAIKNLMNRTPDPERQRRLLEHSCLGDRALFDRIAPTLICCATTNSATRW